jgi:carboxypeptidase C (cathepsin A)
MRTPLFTALILSTSLLTLRADQTKKEDKPSSEAAKTEEKNEDKPSAPVSNYDSVVIDGKKISYKVTAAKLQLKKEDGKARASIFHTTYERTDLKGDQSKRPVLFAFNGGPGSSSVWLHLGALGPRIVPTSPDGTKPLAPPHQVIANPHSILDVADLVFIDPVSTGYSRVEKDAKSSEFHGLEGDIESVGDFIRRWITEHKRWNSPKFLLGESYGGIRAAGLANHLQGRYGMHLNGVVLLSSLLDFRTLRSSQGDDLTYLVYLPVLTATAHHHGKIEGDRDKLVAEARRFALQEYQLALSQGSELPKEEKQKMATKLAQLTGISSEIWLESELRVSATRFRKELLRKEGLVLGRFDARVAWPASSQSSDFPSYDPSYAVAYGPFSTAMLDYLTRDLGWEEDNPYEILSSKVRPWKWGTENGIVNLSSRLATAMRDNPSLRVLVQCGHTDLATPPPGIEHSFRHMFSLPEERKSQVEFTYYDAGHMFYLNQPDLEKMRVDLVEFLSGSAQ